MSNHIDLTSDSPDDFQNFGAPPDAARYAKRPRTYPPSQEFTPSPSASQISSNLSTNFMPPFVNPPFSSPPILSPSVFAPSSSTSAYISGFSQSHYRPPFAGHIQYPPANIPALLNDLQYQQNQSASTSCQPAERDIIDLTSSPSPPPMTGFSSASQPSLPPDLPPKTPVCIGQLSATALILYPILYTMPQTPAVPEWVPVRFEYELSKTGKEAIHIKTPSARGPSGESIPGETFGVIEQKVANYLGPMLGKGLIRLDPKICRGSDVCPMPSFFLNILT